MIIFAFFSFYFRYYNNDLLRAHWTYNENIPKFKEVSMHTHIIYRYIIEYYVQYIITSRYTHNACPVRVHIQWKHNLSVSHFPCHRPYGSVKNNSCKLKHPTTSESHNNNRHVEYAIKGSITPMKFIQDVFIYVQPMFINIQIVLMCKVSTSVQSMVSCNWCEMDIERWSCNLSRAIQYQLTEI